MGKIISAIIALSAVTAIAGVSVYAATEYSGSDLKNTKDFILGVPDAESTQDVNNDKRVDVFDLTEMRKQFTDTGEAYTAEIPASEENVKYTGRNFFEDNTVWLVQSGSAVEFTVRGTSAQVQIIGDGNIHNDEKYRPRYAVIVDGEIILDELLSTELKTVELFSGEEMRTAEVKIIHLSEANNGAVGVGNITAETKAQTPVVPADRKYLSIEFIGDSITCAYGVEGANQYENFMTSTENFMKSYAYLTAQKLNADYSAVSYSGHGIISGYTATDEKSPESLVPEYYGYVGKISPYNQYAWDFEKHKNDVVVINLGTNDSTYIDKDFESRSAEFVEGYENFLEDVRNCNPDAYIICTLGTMGCEAEYPLIEQAVENFRNNTGDERIMSYQSAAHTMNDGYGSDWHPSEVTQQNSAYVLADKICEALGLESDQLGLNVAADVSYRIDTSDNAMVSDYFSDWDKSYHITAVTGGTDKNSIIAIASGIGLKKGGEYNFSFQCNTDKGGEIPFGIYASDGTLLFEDVFTGTGEQSQYESEFTSSYSGDAEIRFFAGGKDNARVSLHELKLVKTG